MGCTQSHLGPKTIKELQQDCDFDAEEIEDWYSEFKSRCQKNHPARLTLQEFADVYKSIFNGDAAVFAEHVFRTFDIDKNGLVDFREFLIGLSVTASGNFEKKMKWAFNMYDIDGNGYISRNEMKHMFTAWFKMLGIVPADEKNKPENLTDKFFREMDKNNDDRISWEEFTDAVSNDSFLLDILQCHPNVT